ncbi:DUF2063 domain-containing protein [Pleionea sp. CnH1-48]|uniref:HvfC family RiPP maturation protein n=1 Tax=Pleionea sp. CnH1-48 TaxID=2954494 RepID=UPI0020968301|nr:putative DNA-binding domain-containing protein [Pleionea sp. CnH1-48]MCO7223608.1 putative DNA-binding domain-containing protein [Pleionea sp. CnH1-48]
MASMPSFQQAQYEFAAHIRDPEQKDKPQDVEERRMEVYRNLFYSNVEGFIKSGFPVLHSLLEEDEWNHLVRTFFASHQAKTPYFAEISKEFVSFLEDNRLELYKQYPFLPELAHYEWVELALYIDTHEIDEIELVDSNDILNHKLAFSPVAWPLAYEFDVHHISEDYSPTEAPAQPSFYVVYRDREDDIEFLEINAVTFQLIQLIKEFPEDKTSMILERLCSQLPQFEEGVIMSNGLNTILQLMQRDIILGLKH